MIYVVNHSGGTIGAKSGNEINYVKGVPVECADGDLDHVGGAVKQKAEKKEDEKPQKRGRKKK